MAFAPHTNEAVKADPTMPLILGSFREVDYGHLFEYAQRVEQIMFEDFPHLIYVGNGPTHTRYARVLKTVAYVVVDEEYDGTPVVQKWQLKQHHQYQTDWVAREAS